MTIRHIVISAQHQKIQLNDCFKFTKVQVLNLRFDNPYTGSDTMQIAFGNGMDKNEMILADNSIIQYFYNFPIIDSTITNSQHHDSHVSQYFEPMGKSINHFDINLYLDGVPIAVGDIDSSKKIYLELLFE